MEVVARSALKPLLNERRLMRGVVVQHEVNFDIAAGGVEGSRQPTRYSAPRWAEVPKGMPQPASRPTPARARLSRTNLGWPASFSG